MKNKYSSPITEIIFLNISTNVMDDAPVADFSNTTGSYDGNSNNLEIEEDESYINPSINLWD